MEMLIVKEIASQGLRKYDSILEPYPFVSLSSLLRSTIPDLEFGKTNME